jgi:hypothetical protein
LTMPPPSRRKRVKYRPSCCKAIHSHHNQGKIKNEEKLQTRCSTCRPQ